jgi:hypothetical protein
MIWTPRQKRIVKPSLAECRATVIGVGTLGAYFKIVSAAGLGPGTYIWQYWVTQ